LNFLLTRRQLYEEAGAVGINPDEYGDKEELTKAVAMAKGRMEAEQVKSASEMSKQEVQSQIDLRKAQTSAIGEEKAADRLKQQKIKVEDAQATIENAGNGVPIDAQTADAILEGGNQSQKGIIQKALKDVDTLMSEMSTSDILESIKPADDRTPIEKAGSAYKTLFKYTTPGVRQIAIAKYIFDWATGRDKKESVKQVKEKIDEAAQSYFALSNSEMRDPNIADAVKKASSIMYQQIALGAAEKKSSESKDAKSAFAMAAAKKASDLQKELDAIEDYLDSIRRKALK